MSTHSDSYARLAAERNRGGTNPLNATIIAAFRRRLSSGEDALEIARSFGLSKPHQIAMYVEAARQQ